MAQNNAIVLVVGALSLFVLAINPSLMGIGSAPLIMLLLWLGLRSTQMVNPYLLFIIAPLSTILYSTAVSPVFLPELDNYTQFVILMGLYSYVIGLMCVQPNKRRLVSRSANYSFLAIFIIGLIPHLAGIAVTGLPILSENVRAARDAYLLPFIGQFVIFLPLSILIAFKRQSRYLVLLSTSVAMALSVASATKFLILFTALFIIFGYIRYEGRNLLYIKPIYLILLSAASLPLAFNFVFNVRDVGDQTVFLWTSLIYFNYDLLDQNAQYTYLPYLYLTTPISNFAYVVEVQPELTLGARSIFPVAAVLQLDGFLTLEPRPIRMPQFNTHTFITDFYIDFGVPGVMIMSLLLGVIVKITFLTAHASRDVMAEGAWVCVGFASFMLFFSNHFTGLTYPIIAIIIFNAIRLIVHSRA